MTLAPSSPSPPTLVPRPLVRPQAPDSRPECDAFPSSMVCFITVNYWTRSGGHGNPEFVLSQAEAWVAWGPRTCKLWGRSRGTEPPVGSVLVLGVEPWDARLVSECRSLCVGRKRPLRGCHKGLARFVATHVHLLVGRSCHKHLWKRQRAAVMTWLLASRRPQVIQKRAPPSRWWTRGLFLLGEITRAQALRLVSPADNSPGLCRPPQLGGDSTLLLGASEASDAGRRPSECPTQCPAHKSSSKFAATIAFGAGGRWLSQHDLHFPRADSGLGDDSPRSL